MWKKVLGAVFGLLVVIGALGGVKAAQIGAMIEAGENAGPPPVTVSTVEVRSEQWGAAIRAVGSLVATQSVLVAAEVPGLVNRLAFQSGDLVKKGQILVELDAAIERAQLASAVAALKLAEVSLERAKKLAREQVNAPAELDAAEAQDDQARAQVQNIRAQIAKKTIRAPFAGKLGIRQVDLGQIVSAGSPLVQLQDTERLFADFYLPQRDLAELREGQTVAVTTDAQMGVEFSGKIDTIEPSVDPATRNVRVRAVLDNPDGALRPGLFVEVAVTLPDPPPVLTIPATSVVYAPYGNSVFVVKGEAGTNGAAPTKTVEQVFVQLGLRRGDFVAVESGLERGQTVVAVGGFKLSNGATVVIDNSKPLDPKLAPDPKDS